MKKWFSTIALVASVSVANAQNKVNYLLEFLTVNKPVQAEFIQVETDPGMALYATIISKARKKDPKWFAKHQTKAEAGMPLTYHEKLMTKTEYEGYLATWNKRKVAAVKGKNGQPVRVSVILSKESDGSYIINVVDVPISNLKYDVKSNSFSSFNGKLNFLEKVDAPEQSALRAWNGYEWKSERKQSFSTTKENFAIGRTANQKFGYLIYRFQQISKSGQSITDRRYVLRFAPVKKAKK